MAASVSFLRMLEKELIYYIKQLMSSKRIPYVPVYVDSPMASNATGVFNIHPECLNDKIVKDKNYSRFSVEIEETLKDDKLDSLIKFIKEHLLIYTDKCEFIFENKSGIIINNLNKSNEKIVMK